METLFLVVIFLANILYAGPIPDTGQSQSYTDEFGEDSDYLINDQKLTRLDLSGNETNSFAESWAMVRDDVTGLIWEVKKADNSIQDKSKQFSWYDPADITNGGYAGINTDGSDTNDYIRNLNFQAYGGFTDWRLPSIYELATLLNMNQTNGIQSEYFPDIMQGGYWTSTTYAGNAQKAWNISFATGKNAYNEKSYAMYVRAVRGKISGIEFSRFVNNMDGTITDTLTGLMWQNDYLPESMTWEEAISEFNNNLLLANHTDWRLPTREELRSIVDYDKITPSIYVNEFPNTALKNYWTSTAHPFQENHIWCIHFYNGNDNYQSKNNKYYSRAVRGGQDQSDNEKILILSPAQGSTWEKEQSMPIQWEHRNIAGNVQISISRNGGPFELIEGGKTTNNGQFTWFITGQISPNCRMRIRPEMAPEKENIQSFFRIIASEKPVLEVTPIIQEVSPLSGVIQFSIINNGTTIMDWQAIVQDTWLHGNTIGTDNSTLEIQYDNNAGEARTGHVKITAPGAMYSPQTIIINQQAGYPVIYVAPDQQTISAFDDTVMFNIRNDGTTFLAWTATIQDSCTWLDYFGNSSGTDTGQLIFRVNPNYGATRTANVFLTAPRAINSPVSITITQMAGFPLLKVTPESKEVAAESNAFILQVVNAGSGNMSWTATKKDSNDDWLIIDTPSGTDDGIIRVRCQSNDSLERTGIIVVSTDDGQTKNVSIIQKPGHPVLIVSPEAHRVSGNEGIVSYTITNGGSGILNWSAISNASWLTIMNNSEGIISGNADNQETYIRVKYSQNNSSPRIGLITVASTSISQTPTQIRVSVYQESLESYHPPDWVYNPKNYQYQCMLVAAVYNNKKQIMAHENDILAAFINGKCRGLANPQESPFGMLYFLQIWSNNQDDVVTFQFFDSDTGTIFSQITEKIVFGVNASFGSMYSPFEINITEVDVNIPMTKGWNWVSMNVRAKDMRLNSLFSSINGQSQVIVGQTGFAEYYGEKWYGTIEEIDPTQMYLIKMFNDQTFTYSGDPVYYENITIQLGNGWNWIGYLPYFEMDINIALKSLGSSADRIVGQGGYSEYSDGWWGGLTVLKPSHGYQILVSEPSELNYPRLENTTKRAARKGTIHQLSNQFGQYRYPSCLTVQLQNNNQFFTPGSKDRIIARSKSGEIRGVAFPRKVLGKSLFFLQVWMQSKNEIIDLQYEPADRTRSLKPIESIKLNAYDVLGNIESPLSLNVAQDYLELLIEILQILAGGQ